MSTPELPHGNYYKITFSPANPEIVAKTKLEANTVVEQEPKVFRPQEQPVETAKFPPSRWLDLMEEDFIEEPVDDQTAIRFPSEMFNPQKCERCERNPSPSP